MVIVLCLNFFVGYFNVYNVFGWCIDIDVIFYLGDYIYEYVFGGYGM